MAQIKTTIGILTHNRSWHFAQCLASIRQWTRADYKILVIDTHSEAPHIQHMQAFAGPDIEFVWHPEFLSCIAGRRELTDRAATEFLVFIDDDIRVGPEWLSSMLKPMENDSNAGAAAANIAQEGTRVSAGVRRLEKVGANWAVREYSINYQGTADLCCGGATIYRTDALQATKYRDVFAGGYEDWDQTLQITRDLGLTIYGTRATLFHKHMLECRDYFSDRWRWRELMEAALAMYDIWGVRTGVDKTVRHWLSNEITIPRDQAERIVEVIT